MDKMSVKQIVLTTLIVLASTAFAAETMRYTAAAGTITKYSSSTNTTTQLLEPVTAIVSDGSEPSTELMDSFNQIFATTENSSVSDITETVLEVQADGTRIVTKEAIKAESSPSAPALKFTTRSAYKPNGTIEIQEVKYDTDSLQNELSDVLEETDDGVKKATQTALQGLYGVAFETNVPINRTVEDACLEALAGLAVGRANVNCAVTTTMTGRGPNGQYQFRIETNTPEFDFKLAHPGVDITYKVEPSTASSTNSYLIDGRVETSKTVSKTRMILDIDWPVQKTSGTKCASSSASTRVPKSN
jgi:hypothetical protein